MQIGRLVTAVALAAACCACSGTRSAAGHQLSGSLRLIPVAGAASPASTVCPKNYFAISPETDEAPSELAAVTGGHTPRLLPVGFGLREVDRLADGPTRSGSGYAAWTDAQCRRVNVYFDPNGHALTRPAKAAFGPWVELQRCGTPRPCIVYQALTHGGGVLTVSTWQLSPATAAAIVRSVPVA
ncbi:MAG TPA: hypothetical protein VHC43_15170 [Mycobacteriales bacterium]|nr:hypothetical protein [Mycobacteriales bacterium]